MRKIFMLIEILCMLCLTSCMDADERSYLHTLVTAEQTIIRGGAIEDGKKLTPKDIYYFLRGTGIEISLEDYVFEETENTEGLLYYVNASSLGEPNFRVYQFGNFWGITCDRAALAQAIQNEESVLHEYALNTGGTMVGCYDIGKESIGATDTEDIGQIEGYIRSLFPGIDFSQYRRTMITGDAGQNLFLYTEKDGNSDQDIFYWSSYLQDSYIEIYVRESVYLDEMLHISKQ